MVDVDAARDRFRLWSENPYFDEATRQELQTLAGDEAAVADRFGGDLQFGTAGLRGLIGAGTKRINLYTIRQATQGLASYMKTFGGQAMQRGVVIAHDPRRFSAQFAREAALTLNTAGIVAYLWDSLRPTPMLSFAVRELGAMAGIMITASHNPKEYNGYKVYWEDGGQVPPERAAAIQEAIRAIEDITVIRPMEEGVAREAGLLRPVPPEVDRRYLELLLGLLTTTAAERSACSVLYTPLHGTGSIPVQRALLEAGFRVSTVAGQQAPDPEFSTVQAPNPEDPAVFHLARLQAELEQPDVVLATDPDADRLGVLAKEGDRRYRHLTGNEIGALLTDFILTLRSRAGTLPANGVVIKSIATSNQVAGLCRRHGIELMETHVGFKYIGDKIRAFEETGSHTFLLGFEESYGYLGATFVRDKDAVMAALLVAEAAAYHKGQGRTLCDALAVLWRQYGCFREGVHSVTLPGDGGQAQIARLMERLRQNPPRAFAGLPVMAADDYQEGRGICLQTGEPYDLLLGRANVLHYRFPNGGFVMVRPSGTEPKLKLYVSVSGQDIAEADHRLAAVQEALLHYTGLDGG